MNDKSLNSLAPEDRAGRLLAARLDDGLQELGADIGERLRFARERAVARARQSRLQAATAPGMAWAPAATMTLAAGGASMGGAFAMGTGGHPGTSGGQWWNKLVSVLPLLILALGFFAIQDTLMERQIQAAAEVDAALLADDLPPQAYSDPGFAEFLRRQER